MKSVADTKHMIISIVIPVHNEAGNIEQLAKEIDNALQKSSYNTEVIFVNDASTDNTGEILNRLEKLYSFVKVLNLEERGGQTGCFQKGFQEAKGKYIIRMDGDLQDNPLDLIRFFELLGQDPDIIMGLRTVRKHRKVLRVATMIYDIFVVILFDSPLYTNSSSFVAFKAKFLKGVQLEPNDHRYLSLIAMNRGAVKLKEVVVENRDRVYGQSKYGVYTKFIFSIFELLKVFIRLKSGHYNVQSQPLPKEIT